MNTGDKQLPRHGRTAVRPSVLAGLAAVGVLLCLLVAAGVWSRRGAGSSWSLGEAALLALLLGVVVVLAAVVWRLAVGRRGLRETVAQQEREIAALGKALDRTQGDLSALCAINHELIRAKDEATLLTRLCQVLVEVAGYGLAWVAMIEPGPDKTVRVAARAGAQAESVAALGVRFDESFWGQGPTGTALREKRVVVEPDTRLQQLFHSWPDRPRNLDWIASAVSLPLFVGEQLVGAMTMYEPAAREYGQREMDLLAQMAADVSYALRFLRVGQQRERATRLLRQAWRVSSAMARSARELVSRDHDVPGMASLVLHQAIVLTGSSWGGVGVLSKRSGRVAWVAAVDRAGKSVGSRPEGTEQFPDDAGRYHGPLAAVLNDGVNLYRNEAVCLEGACPQDGDAASVSRFLAVPLRGRENDVAGVLLLVDAQRPYVDQDVRAVQRLAVLLDMGISRRLAEEAAKRARQRAEAANEAKTQFLANISQELRTPINGILGMTQLALLEGGSEHEAENWRTVRDSTDRLVEMVDNLLELANVEAGSLSPMLREFSLLRILESLRGAFAVRAGLAGLTLDVEAAPGIPDKLLGDPFRLRQILSNLLDNAIRFTPTGAVSVRVRPYQADGAAKRRVFVAEDFRGISLLFTVSDTGIGILPDRQTAIFESFALGEDYLTKRFGGAGMGLTIAKRLADLLGGSLWVESQPGLGSTFYLTMPFWPAAQESEPAAAPVGQELALPPLRFLVVEDEAVNRLALVRGLRKLGHAVVEAANGEEALRQLARERVDVVVMDVQMPIMDGLTAVGHIRGGEVPGADRRVPVVALTAYALEGDRKRFLDAGMDEFVTKPCGIDHLLHVVAKVLRTRSSA